MRVLCVFSLITLLIVSGRASAATVQFTNELAFQLALTESYTLVNLDTSTLTNLTDVTSTAADSFFNPLGLDFVNSQLIFTGNDYQTPKASRDLLIGNGAGTTGGMTMLFNLLSPVDGVGAWSNLFEDGDGGFIRAFSGSGGTGVLVGEAPFGVEVPLGDRTGFGGLIAMSPIQSVMITCTQNFDLRCGVFDIQFGNVNPVPLPAAAWLFISALGGLVVAKRKQLKA